MLANSQPLPLHGAHAMPLFAPDAWHSGHCDQVFGRSSLLIDPGQRRPSTLCLQRSLMPDESYADPHTGQRAQGCFCLIRSDLVASGIRRQAWPGIGRNSAWTSDRTRPPARSCRQSPSDRFRSTSARARASPRRSKLERTPGKCASAARCSRAALAFRSSPGTSRACASRDIRARVHRRRSGRGGRACCPASARAGARGSPRRARCRTTA